MDRLKLLSLHRSSVAGFGCLNQGRRAIRGGKRDYTTDKCLDYGKRGIDLGKLWTRRQCFCCRFFFGIFS